MLVFKERAAAHYKLEHYKGKFDFLDLLRFFLLALEAADDILEAVKHGFVINNNEKFFFMLK